jgi:hypothetical protein
MSLSRQMNRRRALRDSSERQRLLEEAVRLLEAARTGPTGGEGFDDARVDGHIATALTAARAALSVTNSDTNLEEPAGPTEVRET